MRIQTIDYPVPRWLGIGNSGSDYLSIQVVGAVGRSFGYANWVVSTDGFYDNMAFFTNLGGIQAFSGYINNGSGVGPVAIIPSGTASNPVDIRPGSYQDSYGYVGLDLVVETGVATNAYVPLAESGLSYTVTVVGAPAFEVLGGPEPPVECFWTDLVRVQQTGCE